MIKIPKKAIYTLAYCITQALVVILTAVYFQGVHFNKVLPLSIALLMSGITIFFAILAKGRKYDHECDERELLITDKAMKFCFYFLSFVLLAYWAYDVSLKGTFLSTSTLILYLFWGSFIGAYGINKLRY